MSHTPKLATTEKGKAADRALFAAFAAFKSAMPAHISQHGTAGNPDACEAYNACTGKFSPMSEAAREAWLGYCEARRDYNANRCTEDGRDTYYSTGGVEVQA